MPDGDGEERPPHVLVVDDDPEIGKMLERALARRGFAVEAVSVPEDALARATQTPYDAAVVDLVMPGRDGAHLAAELRRQLPGLPIALLTGYVRSPLLERVERPGVKVFAKPIVIHELVDYLEAEIGG